METLVAHLHGIHLVSLGTRASLVAGLCSALGGLGVFAVRALSEKVEDVMLIGDDVPRRHAGVNAAQGNAA